MQRSSETLSTSLSAVFLAGATAALGGGLWDDAWHTERGRDSFFIAPHLAIYGGIAGAGAALTALALLRARRVGWRSALEDRALLVAVIALVGTMLSAPIDNAWHLAFGRDAVLWSPPHMLGIVGSMGLAFAMLLHVQDLGRGRLLAPLAAGLLVSAAVFTVAEYETDVPQFSPLWYPVAYALCGSLALTLVRAAWPGPWSATTAAAVQTAFVLGVGLFLSALGFDQPSVSVLLLPALVIDIGARRGWSASATAAAVALVVVGLVVPFRQAFDDLGITWGQAVIALPLTWVAALVGLALARGEVPRLRRGVEVVAATVTLCLTLVAGAAAHDPGQGAPAGKITWTVQVRGDVLDVQAADSRLCRGGQTRFAARRGGAVIRTSVQAGGCVRRAHIALPRDGRWFIYLTSRQGAEDRESWVPVHVGGSALVRATRGAYEPRQRPSSVVKWLAGVVLYGAIVAFVVALGRLARRRRVVALSPTATG